MNMFGAATPRFLFSAEKPAPNAVDEESHADFQAKKKTPGVDGSNLTDEQALEMIHKVFIWSEVPYTLIMLIKYIILN